MGGIGLTSSQISAAGAYARSERLVAESIPVRAIDPTRQRFQVDERDAADQAVADSRAEADSTGADGRSPSSAAEGGKAGTGWGGNLLGAFTSFLTRMFAQPEAEASPLASTAQAGALAYARTAASIPADLHGGPELLSPNFPRLSSGRALDLTV